MTINTLNNAIQFQPIKGIKISHKEDTHPTLTSIHPVKPVNTA